MKVTGNEDKTKTTLMVQSCEVRCDSRNYSISSFNGRTIGLNLEKEFRWVTRSFSEGLETGVWFLKRRRKQKSWIKIPALLTGNEV